MSSPSSSRRRRAEKLATKSSAVPAANTREDNPPRPVRGACGKSGSTLSTGALRRRRPISEAIQRSQAADVLAALIHASHVGLVPKRMMSINLQAGGVEDSVATIGRLMKLMRDAMRQHGGNLPYIWVREVGNVVGDHVHVLFHLPPGAGNWLAKRKPGWLRRCGIRRGKGVSHTVVIRGAPSLPDVEVTCPHLYAGNLRNVTAYVLKHCSPDVQRDLGIISRGPCRVAGKRVSISQNLHRGARSTCHLCATST